MTSAASIISDMPGPDETVIDQTAAVLLTRDMLLSVDAEMAIVRIFGSDKSGNAVRVGLTPERALRIGAAFIRAGLRINPALRFQLVEDAIGKAGAAEIRAVIGEGGS